MKSKIKPKSTPHISVNKKDKNKSAKNENKTKEKFFPKKEAKTLQNNSKNKINIKSNKDENKIKTKLNNNLLNIEDSSTNYFSGINKKNIIPKFDCNILNNKKKDNCIIPLLIKKESETESLFINFKLGEKDSYTESTLRSDLNNFENESKNINNKKLNNDKNVVKNYEHCEVDCNIGKNESDSLEIYDFSDKTNVDYVLRNLSALSSKSGKEKSSFILDDFNDEDISGNKKMVNKIKIFNTKQSLSNNCTKLRLNNNNALLQNNQLFRPNNK